MRFLVTGMKAALAPDAAELTDIAARIDALSDAVNEALPMGELRQRRRGRERDVGFGTPTRVRKLLNKLNYARRRRAQAETKLRAMQKAKEDDGKYRTTSEFLAKIVLSSPSACGRAFAEAWADLIGVGASGCSRRTIDRAR
ncbi:MAG: hypothetical protein GY701_34335, partial [Sulfitobacter sp.]|nr:hypothetical protein [Sulfitobacter sp.]